MGSHNASIVSTSLDCNRSIDVGPNIEYRRSHGRIHENGRLLGDRLRRLLGKAGLPKNHAGLLSGRSNNLLRNSYLLGCWGLLWDNLLMWPRSNDLLGTNYLFRSCLRLLRDNLSRLSGNSDC